MQPIHEPLLFIAVLREYHDALTEQRARPPGPPGTRAGAGGDDERQAGGSLANALSDVIITKRVDLAQVRRSLLEQGAHELMDTLDRLIDLIEPYIEEGGVEE